MIALWCVADYIQTKAVGEKPFIPFADERRPTTIVRLERTTTSITSEFSTLVVVCQVLEAINSFINDPCELDGPRKIMAESEVLEEPANRIAEERKIFDA